jgi:hypothetical protein
MANSDLIGRHWKIPKKHLRLLKNRLRRYTGAKDVEGYTRLQNLIETGEISYENLKNVKHILEKNSGNKNIYNLNGGKNFHNWVNDQLKVARDRLSANKKIRKDTGEENAYIKHHNKDNSKQQSKVRNPKLHKSMGANDIYNNNVNYESIKITKAILTEAQIIKIINS